MPFAKGLEADDFFFFFSSALKATLDPAVVQQLRHGGCSVGGELEEMI